jgi:hypothetical protein
VASRLGARLAKLEAQVMPDDDPGKCWEIVIVQPDGSRKVRQTICWSRTRGSWRKPAPNEQALQANVYQGP